MRKGGISNFGCFIFVGFSLNSGVFLEIVSFVGKVGIIGGVMVLMMKIV